MEFIIGGMVTVAILALLFVLWVLINKDVK